MEDNLSEETKTVSQEEETREQDAPVEDAQLEEQAAAEEEAPEISARESVVESIAAKRAEERDQMAEESAEELEGEEETQLEVQGESQESDETVSAQAGEESSDEEMVELDVNGQKQMVPVSKLIEAGTRTIQKESSADLKLQNAALREKQLNQREEHLNAMLQKYSAVNDDFDADKWQADFRDALVDDEEKAAEMMGTMIKKMSSQNQQIGQMARDFAVTTSNFINEQKTTEKTKMLNLFKREFPDLAKDPLLITKANQATAQIKSKYPNMAKEDVVLAAGKAVRQYYHNILGVQGEAVTHGTGKETPTSLKRKMPPPIKKTFARAPGKKKEVPLTRQQVIAGIKEQRNQNDP